MEIKAELLKPYTFEEKRDFILLQNRQNGYTIEEQKDKLVALGYTEEEIEKQKQEKLSMLNLTSADVERGIYKAKGMDFDDIITLVEKSEAVGLDIKALKIELKANNFYRGNPYVNAVGKILGFTKEQLDKFFEDGNYEHLLPVEI